jgi:spermidine synthase
MSILLDPKDDGSLAFFLDGDLQFDSRDERNYHECLALPAQAIAQARLGKDLKALIIGGGDGLTARELLKANSVTHIDLVDYDERVLNLARQEFAHLNNNSLSDSRLQVHVEDAWNFVQNAQLSGVKYDIIVCDLTVAQTIEEAAFQSIEWYQLLAAILAPRGVIAANSVSPMATPQAYWSIYFNMLHSGLKALPYHIIVPSFVEQDYGLDWGFIMASNESIKLTEINNQLPLAEPRQALKGVEHLRRLFTFPEEVYFWQKHALPFHKGSDMLLHYFYNSDEVELGSKRVWQSLGFEYSMAKLPAPYSGAPLMPMEISQEVAESLLTETANGTEIDGNGNHIDALLSRVLRLVPSLQRYQTRSIIADFLSNPGAFLDGIDLPGLVKALLDRAMELPRLVVAELKLLQEKLVDWAGDHLSLLKLGSRVLTIVTVVVVLGNLINPDAAFGKGGHGGDHGDHGGRGMDRSAMGEHDGRDGGRGMDRSAMGDRGGHWGHWGGGGRWGHWGGWARSWHRGGWGGWGVWGEPYYAGNGGYVNLNVSDNTQTVDEEGNTYPPNNYKYNQAAVNNYDWSNNPNNNQVSGGPSGNPSDNNSDSAGSGSTQDASDYRLGPDTDILPDGKIAMQLTDKAYLLVSGSGTQLVDQDTGIPILPLASDPSLLYNLGSQIKRQAAGLQSAAQHKQSSSDWSSNLGFDSQGNNNPQKEVDNINGSVTLLNQALQTLGPLPKSAPPNATPPIPGAYEIFNSVWMTGDGKFVVVKGSSGNLAYFDSHGWYSDQGITKVSAPHAAKFKSVIQSYLGQLVKESDSAKASMMQDQKEANEHVQKLTQKLQDYQNPPPDGNNDDGVYLGAQHVSRDEAIRRTQGMIKKAQARIRALQSQIDAMPGETAAASKILAMLQGSAGQGSSAK